MSAFFERGISLLDTSKLINTEIVCPKSLIEPELSTPFENLLAIKEPSIETTLDRCTHDDFRELLHKILLFVMMVNL